MIDILKERSLRKMGKVQEDVRGEALRLIEKAFAEGIYVQISSGYRSFTEQARLYGQGRPDYHWNGKKYGSRGNIVTYAEPGQSNHHDGRAIDFFLVSSDGGKALWTVNDQWRRVAEIAKSMGFTWGGDWKDFKDYAHLELHAPKNGDNKVKRIQTMLAQLGYSLGPHKVDGRYGPDTITAVKKFQRKEHLKEDGVVGPITIAMLQKRTYPGNPIRIGMKGVLIKQVQKVVGVQVDGLFGKRTQAAVRDYQERHGLSVDGIVGPLTWRAMFGI